MTTYFVRATQLVAVSVGLVAVTANPARAQRAEASVDIG